LLPDTYSHYRERATLVPARLRQFALATLPAVALLLAMPPTAFAATTAKPEVLLPRGTKLPAGVAVPNDTALAIYFPQTELESREYVPSLNLWVEPGRALEEARGDEVARKLFPNAVAATPGGAGQYGVLLAIHPEWTVGAGAMRLEMRYRLFDPSGTLLREGSQVQSASVGGNIGALRAITYKTMQLVLVDVLKELQPSAAKFPATGAVASIGPATVVNRKKPVQTGTGFFLNRQGQMLTAAHVVRDCVLIEAQKDGATFPVTTRTGSDLLDLAVLDSGREVATELPFRQGHALVLGESVTNVGFPLSGLLASTPNLTRGNVSARAGIKGSVGLFQFSAPIQPGSSGGPVVSDGGELLGITVSTLHTAALVRQGLLPQNVNFSLDAKHAASFLRQHSVPFAEVPARTSGSMQQANDAALAAVVQLTCYQ
jgi:S1-C subfamily serine protease